MEISIIKHDDLDFWLLFDGKDPVELFSFRERVEIYNRAKKKYTDDYINLYNKVIGNRNHEFLWLITYKNQRPDGLCDIILFYYIVEYIEVFLDCRKVSRIVSSVNLPNYFRDYLKVHYNDLFVGYTFWKIEIITTARNWLSPFSRIKSLFHLLSFKPREIRTNQVFLQSSADFSQMRYRNYNLKDDFARAYIIPKDIFHSVKNIQKKHILIELGFIDLILSFVKAIYFVFSINGKLKTLKSSLLELSISAQVFSQTFYIVFRQFVAKAIMTRYRPRKLIVVQTFGDPQSRFLSFQASQLGIETNVFACRPMVTNQRPEDVIFPFEIGIGGLPLYGVGDKVVLFDKFSWLTLRSYGYPSNRIDYHVMDSIERKAPKALEKGLLFLFTDLRTDIIILKMLDRYLLSTSKLKIYVKFHPLAKMTLIEQNVVFSLFQSRYLDLTSYKLHELDLSSVICFTTYSTSGVEAVAMGGGIVWLTFLTERGIQFNEVMDCIGYKTSSEQELEILLRNLNDDLYFQELINYCQQDYLNHFSIHEK